MDKAAIAARMRALLAEAEEIKKKSEISEADDLRLDEIVTEINTLGEKLERANAQETAAQRARDMLNLPANREVAARARPDAGNDESDSDAGDSLDALASPMERFLASDSFKHYQRQRKGTSSPVTVGSFFRRSRKPTLNFDALAQRNGGAPVTLDQVRALIYTGSATANWVPADVFPTVYGPREPALTMRDVLVSGETESNAIVVLQEGTFTNAAAEVAEATATSGGGYTAAAKPESSLTLTEVSFPVRTIAHWIPITRTALDDIPFLRTYVESRLFVGLRRRENLQFLSGDGIAPNLEGLLNAGIQEADAAYFGVNAVQGVGTAVENFNRIYRGITLVRDTGGAEASFIVMNPADYEAFATLTTATENQYYAGGPFANGGIPRLWGLPVVQESQMTAGTALVGDGLMAAVIDRMDAQIFVADQHSDFFTHNVFVFLAEERVALPVFRPSAFVAVELA
jgi:HK97 family phage major capsid protein